MGVTASMGQMRPARRIGLTEAEYDALLEAQKGRCAICKRKAEKLVVDHRHSDGLIRGLLCDRCNALIGGVQDNGWLLFAAALYLDSPPARMLMNWRRFAPHSIGESKGVPLDHCRHGRPKTNRCPYCEDSVDDR